MVKAICNAGAGPVHERSHRLQSTGIAPPGLDRSATFPDGARRRPMMETTMFRKLSLVAVAAASLGVAALAPTSASAWGGGWHGGYHHGWWGPRVYFGAP